jgi:Raf kinase inhibitor-like YbhB/YbcL family protein
VGRWLAVAGLAVAVTAFACGGGGGGELPALPEAPRDLVVSSSAFVPMGAIPVRYTCDGDNLSPPLSWFGAPKGAVSYALVMDDPDAPGGTFVHWVVYDLPAGTESLQEGVPAVDRLPGGGAQGKNSAGRTGYTGPCPPRGPAHHYRFTVYALDKALGLPPGASQSDVADAMAGHVVAWGQLVGTYQR